MSKLNKTNGTDKVEADAIGKSVNLSNLLAQSKPTMAGFHIWLVGDTPIITHAWSEKARVEMLRKQTGMPTAGREKRDPQADFVNSLYELKQGSKQYGFPAMGVKNCFLSAAHKDKGVPRSTVMSALSIDADLYKVRPALAGAICNMPLLRIYGSPPQMREDMVKIGSGLNKTANLAYRGEFEYWAIKVRGRINTSVLSLLQLLAIIRDAGVAYGLGEWRNERKGVFGAFHLASVDEADAWENFAIGKGKLPVAQTHKLAAE